MIVKLNGSPLVSEAKALLSGLPLLEGTAGAVCIMMADTSVRFVDDFNLPCIKYLKLLKYTWQLWFILKTFEKDVTLGIITLIMTFLLTEILAFKIVDTHEKGFCK